MNIAAVDAILCALLLLSVLMGAWRGVVYELLSLASWVLAFVLAPLFGHAMGALLPLGQASAGTRFVVGLVLVFVLTLVVCHLCIALFRKLVKAVGLGPLDRALGALFGLARGLLLLFVALLLLHRTPLARQPAWQESTAIPVFLSGATILRSVAPQDLVQYLPDQM